MLVSVVVRMNIAISLHTTESVRCLVNEMFGDVDEMMTVTCCRCQ